MTPLLYRSSIIPEHAHNLSVLALAFWLNLLSYYVQSAQEKQFHRKVGKQQIQKRKWHEKRIVLCVIKMFEHDKNKDKD